jgi:hypothetical protein
MLVHLLSNPVHVYVRVWTCAQNQSRDILTLEWAPGPSAALVRPPAVIGSASDGSCLCACVCMYIRASC